MDRAACGRCGSPETVAVGGRVALCEECILRAVAARFPLFELPLEELSAAVRHVRPPAKGPRLAGGA